jgi:hypothetical protein
MDDESAVKTHLARVQNKIDDRVGFDCDLGFLPSGQRVVRRKGLAMPQ